MLEWKKTHNVELVVVSNEPPANLNAFIRDSGLEAVYLTDSDGLITRRYTLGALPYDCAINEEGIIVMDLGLWNNQKSIGDIDRWLDQK